MEPDCVDLYYPQLENVEIQSDAPTTSFANRIKGYHLKKMDVVTPENYPSLYEQASIQSNQGSWGRTMDKNTNILNNKLSNSNNFKEAVLPLST